MLQQFAEQSHCSPGIAAFLDQTIEDLAFIIDGAPQPHSSSGNLHDHFIEMPAAGLLRSGPTQVLCKLKTEFQVPASYCFVADFDAA